MRKIEKAMVKAIATRKDWKSGNTEVANDASGGCTVYLHDNPIAYFNEGKYYDELTWANWPTRTTASRLRALGFQYDKRNNRWT